MLPHKGDLANEHITVIKWTFDRNAFKAGAPDRRQYVYKQCTVA